MQFISEFKFESGVNVINKKIKDINVIWKKFKTHIRYT